MLRALIALSLLTAPLAGMAGTAAPPAGEILVRECLVIPGVGRFGRSAVHQDAIEAEIVAGRWIPPVEGAVLAQAEGRQQRWERVSAKQDGWFEHPSLEGGYADTVVELPAA